MSDKPTASLDNPTGSAEVQPGVPGEIVKITEDGIVRIFENGNQEIIAK